MHSFLKSKWVIAVCVASLSVLAAEPPTDPAPAAYERGMAAFEKGDYGEAFRSLASLAPFEQPEVGIHARYLLGRIHHLSGERPEAAENYKAAVAEFDRQRKAALGKLADPNLTT